MDREENTPDRREGDKSGKDAEAGEAMPEEARSASARAGLGKYLQPRFLLMVWAALGALILAFVLVTAMIPKGKPGAGVGARHALSGEMNDFAPAFPPRKAPLVAFNTPDGGETSLRDFRGKVVLVNVWATWCAPCLEELPSLDELQARLGGEAFQVVAIAAEPRAEERARRFFDRNGIDHLTLYSDPLLSFATTMGGTNVLPVSVLYDARGNEIGRLVGGADWASPEAEALVRAAIAGRPVG